MGGRIPSGQHAIWLRTFSTQIMEQTGLNRNWSLGGCVYITFELGFFFQKSSVQRARWTFEVKMLTDINMWRYIFCYLWTRPNLGTCRHIPSIPRRDWSCTLSCDQRLYMFLRKHQHDRTKALEGLLLPTWAGGALEASCCLLGLKMSPYATRRWGMPTRSLLWTLGTNQA